MKQNPNTQCNNASSCGCNASTTESTSYWKGICAALFLCIGLILQYKVQTPLLYFLVPYLIGYLFVGLTVLNEAWKAILKADFFNEFTLMSVATIGAIAIGEYPEAVAVMLFYYVGELFQHHAVDRARTNIQELLDVRSLVATVKRDEEFVEVEPSEVKIGDVLVVRVGERVPLDGELLMGGGSFDTSALTGESVPRSIALGEEVLAGMINLDRVIELRVTKSYTDSSLSKILHLVEEATSRKAKTELFIRRFAKVYTPIVFFLAVAIVLLPWFFVADYQFANWLYRGLVFLVISCPCALVISIPLGFYGGIGAASRHGILFKGANYLELLTKIKSIGFDKTGTLTQGVFKVKQFATVESRVKDKDNLLATIVAIEVNSTHPIAKAIVQYSKEQGVEKNSLSFSTVKELPGYGMLAKNGEVTYLLGNAKLLEKYNVSYPSSLTENVETTILLAENGIFVAHLVIADVIRSDAKHLIDNLRKKGILNIALLSGDQTTIVERTAKELGINHYYGNLLPEQKVELVKEAKRKGEPLCFVGDGVNDAPVLALSDVGVAMGGMGSDAAIEVADVVIQSDQPSRLITAINIANKTKQIVYQNIALAFGVKAIVLILGGFGLATMWEAVFADVGVALLAILNAVRILTKRFSV